MLYSGCNAHASTYRHIYLPPHLTILPARSSTSTHTRTQAGIDLVQQKAAEHKESRIFGVSSTPNCIHITHPHQYDYQPLSTP